MINKEALLALGKKAVIVNIAHGAVVDGKELVRCLVQGEIAGAGLDVFEKESEFPEELLHWIVFPYHRIELGSVLLKQAFTISSCG